MPNPYLSQSANDIATNLTQNWQQNALPSINSGAMLAGGFGGSRQGVAQALSANGLNQAIGQAQTGLYSNAYNTDQQIQAQKDMQAQSIAAQQKMAEMQNQTQRDLGFGNLGLGYTQAGNQFTLGLGNLGLGNRQADQSYALGLGGLANTAQSNANQYSLGMGNLGLGYTQAQNTYNLGLGQLGLGQYSAETQRGLGYGQLAQQGDQNAFNNQLSGFNAQLQALNALNGWNTTGVNTANQQQQIPLQNLNTLAGIGANIGGQGGTSSTPGPSTLQNALAGGLTLAQLYKLFGG